MTRLLSKKWLPFLLIALLTALVWGRSVTFGFVWDDDFFITRLDAVRSLKNIPAMFTSIEAQAVEPYKFRVFRPIRTAHYALLHALDGHEIPQPGIFHLANILWHGATAMMLFAVLCALLPKLRASLNDDEARTWAFLVALAFAAHPVVSEVVCWAKSLDDILAAFFALASLRELLKPADKKSARWLALFWFALACYSKESAVPFALIPFVIYRCVHKLAWRECAQRTFLFGFVALVYMAHRGYIIERQSQTAPLSGTYAQTLFDMLPVVTKYFRLLWGVPPFLIDYRFMRGGYTVASPEIWLGALLLVLLVAGGIFAWRNKKLKPAGFGLLWAALFLLPVANLLPMMQYCAERFLYLPLIGWLIAAAAVAAALPKQKLARAVALVVIIVWGAAATQRSLIWKDEITLFVTSHLDAPYIERVEKNAVASILYLPQVRRAFHYDPFTEKLTTLAAVNGDNPELLGTMRQAFQILPRNHSIAGCYAISLARSGEPAKAALLFARVARMRPQESDNWLNLARAELDAGRPVESRAAAAKATALAPLQSLVLQFQAELEWRTGHFPASRDAVLRWRSIETNAANARFLADVEAVLASTNAVTPPR